MDTSTVLQKIGLSSREVSMYLATLELGTAAASIIARKAGLPRTTGYSVLSELHKKGFVSTYDRANVKYFTAISGDQIVELLIQKTQKLERQMELVQTIIPTLNTLNIAPVKPPKVQYFEGFEGIQQVYEDTIRGDHTEKFAYFSAGELEDRMHQFLKKKYVPKRVQKKIKAYAIFPDISACRKYALDDEKEYRVSRFVAFEQFRIRSEVNIYADKVAIMSLIAPHYHGVIIQSLEIAETQKAIFELAWKGASL